MKYPAILTALVLFAAPALAQQGPPPATVRLAEIVERDMARTITTPASVVSRSDARIAAEANGRIVFIAEPGDLIEAGEEIARMDDREARLMLNEAQARLERARADLAFQNEEAERMQRLAANGTIATTRVRETSLARDLAVATEREARLAVDRARLDLERTRILAPFTGRVAERLIQVGEYSAPGREIARFVDTDHKEAVAQAPVSIAPFLSVGQMVTLSGEAGDITAPIRAIIPVGDAVSRTFEVRIDLEGSDWVVGTAARAAFPAETPRRQTAAPYDAVILRANGNALFVVDEENVAHRIEVTAGVRQGGFIAIDGEVEPGQRVVVSGAETLQDGRSVAPLAENLEAAEADEAGPSL